MGVGSAREGYAAVDQMHRVELFAGGARSHKKRRWPCGQETVVILWERALPAKGTPRSTRCTAPSPSRAEPAPTRDGGNPLDKKQW